MRAARDLKRRQRPASAPARQLRLPNKQMRALQEYNAAKVNQLVTNMMTALFLAQPEDPVSFMISWLSTYRGQAADGKQGMLRRLQELAPALNVSELSQLISSAEAAAPGTTVERRTDVSVRPSSTRHTSVRPTSARPTSARRLSGAPQAVRPRRVILAGAPLSSEGPHSELLCAHYRLPRINLAALIRDAHAAGTEAGLAAQQALEQQQPVQSGTLAKIVADALQGDDFKEQGWLMAEFPRTAAEATALRDAGVVPDVCVVFDMPDEVRVHKAAIGNPLLRRPLDV